MFFINWQIVEQDLHKSFHRLLGPFNVRLLERGTFNTKILYLLSFHRVLYERDSMTGNKAVT